MMSTEGPEDRSWRVFGSRSVKKERKGARTP